MAPLLDRGHQKRAALILNQPGKPFRLAVAQDFEEGGAVWRNLELQKANLASRALADSKAEKVRPFVVRVPGSEA